MVLKGEAIGPGDLGPALGKLRTGTSRSAGGPAGDGDVLVLGVYLLPAAYVSAARMLLAEARAAGFAQLALQVRATEYPYDLKEYRLTTGKQRSSVRVRVRSTDSIQVLVQGLDVAAARASGSPLRI